MVRRPRPGAPPPTNLAALSDTPLQRPHRHRHAERSALRAPSFRRARHRSRPIPTDRPRPCRSADDLHYGGFDPVSVRIALPFPRMFGQFVADLGRAEAGADRAGHPWSIELRRMDGSAARHRTGRGGRRPESDMVSGGRRRRGSDDAQHPDGESARRRHSRLRAERREVAPGAGLSAASVAAGLRRQHQCQMAAPDQARRGAVRDARGDFEIHDGDARPYHSPVQFRHGGQIRRYLPLRRSTAQRARLLRNIGACLVGRRKGGARRRVDRRRAELARGQVCRSLS